ncbi:MAG: hypothetical protein IKS25_02725, partial [Oscillospiraceae bacterium]|nr:hypothetical protein [Oscillospiraceae bacterium]
MQSARGDPSLAGTFYLCKLSFCAQCLRGAKSKRLFASGILHNAPPIFFSSCRKEDGPRLGLRAAAAGGRRRRHGISAAALFAGRREAGPQKANAARWNQKKRALNALNLCTITGLVIAIVGHCTDPGAIVGLRA